MTKKRFELRLCSNGSYYLHHKGILINNPYVTFDKFNKEDAESIVGELNHLAEENEQLKQTMHEVAELLSEEVDVFSDKALEHDIIAYTELCKLDNKDAYYIATATKKAIKLLKGDVE